MSVPTVKYVTVLGARTPFKAQSTEQTDRTKIPARPLQNSTTLRKSGSPFGLHSHLINGDTFAHSTLSRKILQVYGEVLEIRG